MSEKTDGLTQEELEAQHGEPLPAREVMSTIDLDPGLISIPKDPTLAPVDTPKAPDPT
jgi:hypothetical protein